MSVRKRDVASRPVVSDTSPLINLVGVGLLDLLPSLYRRVWIPEDVRHEYAHGAQPSDPDLDTLPWLDVTEVVVDPALLDVLDDGEAAAITLAMVSNARVLLMDDKLGRRVAGRLGLPVVGTLGVLVAAKQRNLIPSVEPVLDTMISQGRHISAILRARTLYDAGEAS